MLFYTFQSEWMKDNINDLIKVTMDFCLDHSDYIVDYKIHNADYDMKELFKSLSLYTDYGHPMIHQRYLKIWADVADQICFGHT